MGLLLSGKNPAAYKTAERTTFTATAGQTTFTVPVGYNVGDIDVFLNGLKLVEGDDFYATSGTTVVLASGANAGDSLSVICYYNFLNSSSYTKAESDGKYILPNGQTSMTSYLRTPNYGISSYSDSANASLEANPGLGTQGVGIKAWGRSVSTSGGELTYITDTRGASGQHIFYGWNGTSLTQLMKIDTLGRVTKPLQPSFKAGRSTSYTPGANNIVVFNQDSGSSHYNIGGHYNSSTGIFTAPLAGRYHFTCSLIWQDVANNADMTDSFYITINGTNYCYSFRRAPYVSGYTGTSGYYVDHANVVYNLALGDQVAIKARVGNVAHGNTVYCWFAGYMLG